MRGGDWKTAEPGWRYEFPRDHHAHRDFKTEWWYFTGNLFDAEGHRFGYELTFFRQGIHPAVERDPNASRFIVDDLKFAHFAITDVSKRHVSASNKKRAGAPSVRQVSMTASVWPGSTTGRSRPATTVRSTLTAASPKGTIRLHLRATKPPVVHGENGVSVKASASGHASHYYSIPRLETTGEICRER